MPMHKDLRLAGQLPPLDAPHHMRASEWAPFREGVVTRSAHGAGSILNVGFDKARAALPLGHTCPMSRELQQLERGVSGLAHMHSLRRLPAFLGSLLWIMQLPC